MSDCGDTAGGNGIWVVAESAGEEINEHIFALLSEARKLSSQLGPVSILMTGKGADQLVPSAGHYGAGKAIVVGPGMTGEPSPQTLADLFADQVRTHTPRLVMFPATKRSIEITVRTAARLCFPLVTGGIGLNIGDGGRIQVAKLAYGGNVYRTYEGDPDLPLLVTIKPGVFDLDQPDRSRRIELLEVPYETTSGGDEAVGILEIMEPDPATQDLSEAQIVIACGRGLGHRDNLRLVEELAELLGGGIGGTRVAVDAGWIPFSKQIGQTGKVIAPRLYIACGISGASHHLAGVQDSKLIVAINKDRNAPIMKMADIAVVGDLLEVIPEMIAEIRTDQEGGRVE